MWDFEGERPDLLAAFEEGGRPFVVGGVDLPVVVLVEVVVAGLEALSAGEDVVVDLVRGVEAEGFALEAMVLGFALDVGFTCSSLLSGEDVEAFAFGLGLGAGFTAPLFFEVASNDVPSMISPSSPSSSSSSELCTNSALFIFDEATLPTAAAPCFCRLPAGAPSLSLAVAAASLSRFRFSLASSAALAFCAFFGSLLNNRFVIAAPPVFAAPALPPLDAAAEGPRRGVFAAFSSSSVCGLGLGCQFGVNPLLG